MMKTVDLRNNASALSAITSPQPQQPNPTSTSLITGSSSQTIQQPSKHQQPLVSSSLPSHTTSASGALTTQRGGRGGRKSASPGPKLGRLGELRQQQYESQSRSSFLLLDDEDDHHQEQEQQQPPTLVGSSSVSLAKSSSLSSRSAANFGGNNTNNQPSVVTSGSYSMSAGTVAKPPNPAATNLSSDSDDDVAKPPKNDEPVKNQASGSLVNSNPVRSSMMKTSVYPVATSSQQNTTSSSAPSSVTFINNNNQVTVIPPSERPIVKPVAQTSTAATAQPPTRRLDYREQQPTATTTTTTNAPRQTQRNVTAANSLPTSSSTVPINISVSRAGVASGEDRLQENPRSSDTVEDEAAVVFIDDDALLDDDPQYDDYLFAASIQRATERLHSGLHEAKTQQAAAAATWQAKTQSEVNQQTAGQQMSIQELRDSYLSNALAGIQKQQQQRRQEKDAANTVDIDPIVVDIDALGMAEHSPSYSGRFHQNHHQNPHQQQLSHSNNLSFADHQRAAHISSPFRFAAALNQQHQSLPFTSTAGSSSQFIIQNQIQRQHFHHQQEFEKQQQQQLLQRGFSRPYDQQPQRPGPGVIVPSMNTIREAVRGMSPSPRSASTSDTTTMLLINQNPHLQQMQDASDEELAMNVAHVLMRMQNAANDEIRHYLVEEDKHDDNNNNNIMYNQIGGGGDPYSPSPVRKYSNINQHHAGNFDQGNQRFSRQWVPPALMKDSNSMMTRETSTSTSNNATRPDVVDQYQKNNHAISHYFTTENDLHHQAQQPPPRDVVNGIAAATAAAWSSQNHLHHQRQQSNEWLHRLNDHAHHFSKSNVTVAPQPYPTPQISNAALHQQQRPAGGGRMINNNNNNRNQVVYFDSSAPWGNW